MAKIYPLLLISILALSASFADAQITINLANDTHPMNTVCEKLKVLTFSFEGGEFQGTQYENLTEFPPEVLSLINADLQKKPDAVKAISLLNGVTFSGEILYNKSLCFNGSFMFNNSELKFFKLRSDPLAGTNDNHIFAHVELIGFENLITDIRAMNASGSGNPLQAAMLFLKGVGNFIGGLLTGDISIKPFGGILKIINGAGLVLNMPDLNNITNTMSNLSATHMPNQ